MKVTGGIKLVSVIISEKPSVAKNIADALHIKNRKDGYFEGNDYIVTWAFGHLFQLYESKDTILPLVNIDEIVSMIDHKLTSHVTKPPKHHTEKTLLRVMETCGKGKEEEDSEEMMAAILSGYSIGTPATRAEKKS